MMKPLLQRIQTGDNSRGITIEHFLLPDPEREELLKIQGQLSAWIVKHKDRVEMTKDFISRCSRLSDSNVVCDGMGNRTILEAYLRNYPVTQGCIRHSEKDAEKYVVVRKALEFIESAEDERRKVYRSGALTGHRMGPFVPIGEMTSRIKIPSPYTEIYEKGNDVIHEFRKFKMGWNPSEYLEWFNDADDGSSKSEDEPEEQKKAVVSEQRRHVERIEEETTTDYLRQRIRLGNRKE